MPPKTKPQRAFVEGSWSDGDNEEDEKTKDEMCLMTQASNELSRHIPHVPCSLLCFSNLALLLRADLVVVPLEMCESCKEFRQSNIKMCRDAEEVKGVEVKREHLISIVGDMLNPEKLLLDAAEKLPTSHSSAA
ncbi:hypothetical protein Tco_0761226 [Tanacetum coccineum]